jgi:CRP-like cAMP-binding protein
VKRLDLLGPTDRILHFRALDALRELPLTLVAWLASRAQEQFFREGARLFREGEAVHGIYSVVEGQVRLTRGGRDIRVVRPQESVGFLECISQYPEGIEAVALEDTLAFHLDVDALMDVFEESFDFYLSFLRNIAGFLLEDAAARPDGFTCAPWRNADSPVEIQSDTPLNLVERMLAFRRTPLFHGIGIAAIGSLARLAEENQLPPGAQLWSRGECPLCTALILEGEVEVRSSNRRYRFGPGHVMGTEEMLCERPRWYDAVARTPLRVLRTYRENLIDILEDRNEPAMAFLGELARIHIENMQRGGVRCG